MGLSPSRDSTRAGAAGSPAGDRDVQARRIKELDPRLAARLRRGVDCNVRVLVRGARGTGKTALVARLEGRPVSREYVPTPEIAVAHVHWRNRLCGRIAKIEAWDVVDIACRPGAASPAEAIDLDTPAGLPSAELARTGGAYSLGPLDTRSVDVYAGAHAIILLFDPQREDTFQAAAHIARKAPNHIPLLLLQNFVDVWGDAPDKIAVMQDTIQQLVTELVALSQDRPVHLETCSITSGVGLRFVHDYLQLPFLLSKKSELLRQLETTNAQYLSIASRLRYTGYDSLHSPVPCAAPSDTTPPRAEAPQVPDRAGPTTPWSERQTTSAAPPQPDDSAAELDCAALVPQAISQLDTFFADIDEEDRDLIQRQQISRNIVEPYIRH